MGFEIEGLLEVGGFDDGVEGGVDALVEEEIDW